jgi:hypothetical protein
MAEQKIRKPGTGVAFINENKKEDWHADFTGEFADHDGNLFYLNVSKKLSGHSGIEYIAVSLGKPKAPKAAPANAAKPTFDDIPDDLPF